MAFFSLQSLYFLGAVWGAPQGGMHVNTDAEGLGAMSKKLQL